MGSAALKELLTPRGALFISTTSGCVPAGCSLSEGCAMLLPSLLLLSVRRERGHLHLDSAASTFPALPYPHTLLPRNLLVSGILRDGGGFQSLLEEQWWVKARGPRSPNLLYSAVNRFSRLLVPTGFSAAWLSAFRGVLVWLALALLGWRGVPMAEQKPDGPKLLPTRPGGWSWSSSTPKSPFKAKASSGKQPVCVA